MKIIIAKKLGMSQRFSEDGTVHPVTLLAAGPCTVTQVKGKEADGYTAVQLGFGPMKKPGKSQTGHLKKSGAQAGTLREFRIKGEAPFKVGDVIDAGTFAPGEYVQVVSVSKGKGFQGVVKRHKFGGGPKTHGHKDNLRMPGSIGSGGIQRVFKGLRMGGRMGGERITVKNLRVIEADAKAGTLAVTGAVPGAYGALVLVEGGHAKKVSWK